MRNLLARLSFATAVATMLVLGCSYGCGASMQQRETAAGSAFEQCAAADFGSAFGSGSGQVSLSSVAAEVWTIVEQGLANWEAALDADAVKVGEDAMGCILDWIEAFLSAPTGSAATAEAPSVLARVRSYHAAMHARLLAKRVSMIQSVTDMALAAVGVDPDTAGTTAFWGRPDPITVVGSEQHR
jgi:hypothetical protein